jgi:23S rRNA (cytidine1920-2'-O)/16S rRNA (cytidine1409-2'-O)-methyltransferase
MKKIELVDVLIKKFDLTEKEAIGLILAGKVLINDKAVTKAGALITDSENIRIKKADKYVSRGAYKLLTAFDHFSISVKDKVCIDVGSSTGGFTQVLLEKGARLIYAVDCGKNLLHYSLRKNNNIIMMENNRIFSLKNTDFKEKIDFAATDVSFSSSINIINYLKSELKVNEIVVLIKPQFEYKRISKFNALSSDFNGVIHDQSDRDKILNFIKDEIFNMGLNIAGIVPSSIKGTKGNLEYLFYIINK